MSEIFEKRQHLPIQDASNPPECKWSTDQSVEIHELSNANFRFSCPERKHYVRTNCRNVLSNQLGFYEKNISLIQ